MSELIQQLKLHEGVETDAYKDHLGLITIGLGGVSKRGRLGCQRTRLRICSATTLRAVKRNCASVLAGLMTSMMCGATR